MTSFTDVELAPSTRAHAVVVRPRTGAHRWARLAAMVTPRLPLLAVLVVTTLVAGRLMAVNTAFLDEATYLNAGHIIWHNWMHGGPPTHYPSYFSGAPVIYPVIAAFVDDIGGLLLARILSLVCVLVTICALHATARRLFDAKTAAWASIAFATVAGTQFLAVPATYDAMALMLVALATLASLRYAQSDRLVPHAGVLLGAPILGLANATKYATALYDPVVIAVVALVLLERYGRRAAVRCAAMFAAVLAALLAAAVALGGPEYFTGIDSTTLDRSIGSVSAAQVLEHAAHWVGALACLSLAAVAVAVWQTRRRGDWDLAAKTSVAILAVLSLAIALSPLEQARIHTTTSLQKHVAFGAWFGAIAVGWLFARISGRQLRQWWRWSPLVAGLVVLGLIGHQQARGLVNAWPNTATLTARLQPFLDKTHKPILMDDGDVAQYYLGTGSEQTMWNNTYYLKYTPPGSNRPLVGTAAYRSAIQNNHFGLVALDFGEEAKLDWVIKRAVDANPSFRYVGRVVVRDKFGVQAYALWLDQAREVVPWV